MQNTMPENSVSSELESYVEVTFVSDDEILIRDSKNPESPTLTFNKGEWDAFVKGVKDGEFDV